MTIQSINPYNHQVLESYNLLDDKSIEQRLINAETGYAVWRALPFNERARHLQAVAIVLRNRKQSLAERITLEMGKILSESLSEIEKCAGQCEYYAQHGEALLQPAIIPSEASSSYVQYQPVGCILGVMPWNFPYWQFFRYAVPLLMAGNVTVLKHASNVPGCALDIEDVFRVAGLPQGVVQTLLVSSAQIENILAHKTIKGVTLTGSDKAGASVASIAGNHIKKAVLELGGSDPFIVLDDAALPETIDAAVKSRMSNAGQVCIAAKRFIVTPGIYDDFVSAFAEKVKNLQQGNGMQAGIQIGPLAKQDIVKDLVEQQNKSIQSGARLLAGGTYDGNNYLPSILENVQPGMPVFDEETFGPLAAVIKVKDEQDALISANKSIYGLAASIWTNDLDKAGFLAQQIEAGSVYINEVVRSDSRFPLGGIKQSGFGRELAENGIREFCNAKMVYIK